MTLRIANAALFADIGRAFGFAGVDVQSEMERASDGTFFVLDYGTVVVDSTVAGQVTTTCTVDGHVYTRVDTISGGTTVYGIWEHTSGGGGGGGSNWLLASGFWNDGGEWDDNATWID